MMQTAKQVIREYCRQGKISLEMIKDQDDINYLSSLIILESKTEDILDHITNNDELINLFTQMAKMTQLIYERKMPYDEFVYVGNKGILDNISYLNNSYAERKINDLFEQESSSPIDD